MARERYPRGEVLQAAYGVLDKYKMNRAFFVKTDQENCETLPPPQEAVDPLSETKNVLKNPENATEITIEQMLEEMDVETDTTTDSVKE